MEELLIYIAYRGKKYKKRNKRKKMGIPHSWRTGSSRGQEHSSTSTPPPMELPMILTPYFPGLILIDQDPCWHIGIYVGE
jgi:hypothetical protein